MKSKIEKFINNLSSIESSEYSTNLYFGLSIEAIKRTENLKLYLELIAENNSKTLLLGEAPGYKGCRNTGIAFTCEHTLRNQPFLSIHNFQTMNHDKPERENSASIIWEEISKKKIYPLIWNIFPFHPHKLNNSSSNRTPNSAELKFGLEYTKELIDIFKIEKILCVGRKSENMIKKSYINYEYIRHPSMGGSNIFREQFDKLLI